MSQSGSANFDPLVAATATSPTSAVTDRTGCSDERLATTSLVGAIQPSHDFGNLQLAVSVALDAALTIIEEDLPGLREYVEDHVVVHLTLNGRRGTLGSFCGSGLLVRGVTASEIHVHLKEILSNYDSRERAEQIVATLLHEAAHAYSHAQGVQDTSRGGRYHNAKFGRVAFALGLAVERHPTAGVHTPGLQHGARERFRDVLADLSDAVVIDRPGASQIGQLQDGEADSGDREGAGSEKPPESTRKHISAVCACVPPRHIRMAARPWSLGRVHCDVCNESFIDLFGRDSSKQTNDSGQ